MEIIALLKKFQRHWDFGCGKMQSDNTIRIYEKKLGVQFPEDYTMLLRNYGYVRNEFKVLRGIDEDDNCDVAYLTQEVRKELMNEESRKSLLNSVVIQRFKTKGYYILKCMGEDAGKVQLILEEDNYSVDQEWQSLTHYLKDAFVDIPKRMEIQAVVELLKEKGKFGGEGPQTDEAIQALEECLGQKFPKGYRELVKHFGCMEFSDRRIFGASSHDCFNVVWKEAQLREFAETPREQIKLAPLPKDAFIISGYISDYGMEASYLVSNADSKSPGRIIEYSFEDYFMGHQCWPTTEAFICDQFLNLPGYEAQILEWDEAKMHKEGIGFLE